MSDVPVMLRLYDRIPSGKAGYQNWPLWHAQSEMTQTEVVAYSVQMVRQNHLHPDDLDRVVGFYVARRHCGTEAAILDFVESMKAMLDPFGSVEFAPVHHTEAAFRASQT